MCSPASICQKEIISPSAGANAVLAWALVDLYENGSQSSLGPVKGLKTESWGRKASPSDVMSK